jgi:16S rRNA (cytidine1402-2'-O)-methyltransferase
MNTDQEAEESQKPLAPGLYLVATPIGNLEDITLRALRVLRSVDKIACEDTRQTQKLLNHFAIHTPTVSYHMHNEAGRATELAAALKAGARIAVVSDAGTPGISDPGGQIAAAAIAAGVPVFPVPGANAAISALVASGLAGEAFTFHGFLPAKEGQRRTALEALKNRVPHVPTLGHGNDPAVVQIFYEAPHRILETLADVEAIFGPAQDVAVARELTKLHEEFLRGAVSEVRKTLADRDSVRGEIVLLFAPALVPPPEAKPASTVGQELRYLIKKEGLTEKDALKQVARARNIGKSEAYRELQRERGK